MRKTIFAVLAIALVALTIGCSKDDKHKDPEIPASGYTSIEDLKEKVADDWIANLAVGDIDDFCFAEYRLAGKEPCYIQLTGTFDESGASYVLDTLNILDWGIEEKYEGYSEAGLSGDAVRIHFEDNSTVYLMVNSVSADSLKCSTAYKGKSAAVNFFRESQLSSYFDVVTSTTKGVKSSMAEDDKQTKAGDLAATPRGIDNANWMSVVKDDKKLVYMTIPGTHDATTYNVQDELAFAARSQEKSLSQQWDCGVRAFDLRMRKEVFTSYMYHDFISCNMLFEDALKEIWNKVKANPKEGAVVILCPEGNGFVNNVGWWGTVITTAVNLLTQFGFHMSDLSLHDLETVEDVVKTINAVVPQNNIAHYDPDMTMGDLRGKILFIARSENWRWYDIGARADSWGANKEIYYKGKDGTVQKSIITVQDNYGPDEGESNGDYISEKRSDFKALWDLKSYTGTNQQYNDPTLVVNQASGFVLDQAFPDYLSACNDLYNDFVGYASSENIGRGIILQDYAGRGETKRISAGAAEACAAVAFAIPLLPRKLMLKAYLALAELAASEKETYGQKLVDAVIDNNFKSARGWVVKIGVQSANEEQGTVDINGTGKKEAEVRTYEIVTLKAYPKNGYSLMKWVNSNGEEISHSETCLLEVRYDDIFTAHFGETCKVTVDVDPECQTMVDIDRGPMLVSNKIGHFASWERSGTTRVYQVFRNDEISLVDGAHSGCELVGWTDSKGKTYGPGECDGIKVDGDMHFTLKLKKSENAKKLTVKASDGFENLKGVINLSWGGVFMSLTDNETGLNYDWSTLLYLSEYFAYNSTFTMEAKDMAGYKGDKHFYYYFKYWTDSEGNQYRDKKISGTLTSDVEYTAVFEEFSGNAHRITASLAAGMGPGWGSASVDKEYYLPGDFATLTATPAPGCSFVCWRNKATGEEFKENPLSVKVENDADYVAYFSKEATDDMFSGSIFKAGDNKYIQFMKGTLVFESDDMYMTEHQYDVPKSFFHWRNEPTIYVKEDYHTRNDRQHDIFFANSLFTSKGLPCRLLSQGEFSYIANHYKIGYCDVCGNHCMVILPFGADDSSIVIPEDGYNADTWNELEKAGSVAIPMYQVVYDHSSPVKMVRGVWFENVMIRWNNENWPLDSSSFGAYNGTYAAAVFLVCEVAE